MVRFADLPHDLIYHIFSLDDNNVVMLQSLSNNFRNLSLTNPFLHFALKDCSNHNCQNFQKYLDKYWELIRTNNISIYRFCIDWTCTSCSTHEGFSIDPWIQEAFRFNVREVQINIRVQSSLPAGILNCDSLTVLKIEAECVYLPKYLLLKSLQELSLRSPRVLDDVPGDSVGEWISRSCPSLKKLSIHNLENNNFIFTSGSIEELKMSINDHNVYYPSYDINITTENLNILDLELPYWCVDEIHMIRVIAPNLHDFTLRAQFTVCDFSGKFPLLYSASISLIPFSLDNIVSLYGSICFAPRLQTNYEVVKRMLMDRQCEQIMGENLHHLVVEIGDAYYEDDNYNLSTIISFLKRLINLKSLVVKQICRPYSVSTNDLIAEDIEPCHLESLKEVVFELTIASMKEIRFIKYLLKYAVNLEKFNIFYAGCLKDIVLGMDAENFEKGSTSVEIFLAEKEYVDMGENNLTYEVSEYDNY